MPANIAATQTVIQIRESVRKKPKNLDPLHPVCSLVKAASCAGEAGAQLPSRATHPCQAALAEQYTSGNPGVDRSSQDRKHLAHWGDMPPASSDPTPTDTPASLRELAARARRLAQELTDQEEANQFIGIAEEMEVRAATLEARKAER
jgi:hypothetical protein